MASNGIEEGKNIKVADKINYALSSEVRTLHASIVNDQEKYKKTLTVGKRRKRQVESNHRQKKTFTILQYSGTSGTRKNGRRVESSIPHCVSFRDPLKRHGLIAPGMSALLLSIRQ